MTAPLRHPVAAARVDPLKAFQLRCWVRAYLWSVCEFEVHEAVDILQYAAVKSGLVEAIGQDAVQRIMYDAFHRVRDRP
jgi:hypothetical protein